MAGILAAAIIVLSQSLYLTQEKTEKVKTEEKKTEKSDVAFISAPADAVSQTNTIQLYKQVPSLDKKITVEENHQSKLVIQPRVFVRYFNILFRAIISPNAP